MDKEVRIEPTLSGVERDEDGDIVQAHLDSMSLSSADITNTDFSPEGKVFLKRDVHWEIDARSKPLAEFLGRGYMLGVRLSDEDWEHRLPPSRTPEVEEDMRPDLFGLVVYDEVAEMTPEVWVEPEWPHRDTVKDCEDNE